MKRQLLMPKLAIQGILNNRMIYLPYLVSAGFGIAVYFIFSCIIDNPLLMTVPHAFYAVMLLKIGRVLLGMILIGFLFYTNSFLIKRRKRELGLYTVLGLEKKHIAFMLFVESAVLFCVAFIGGCIVGSVFSKLLFLMLLKLSHISLDNKFTLSWQGLMQTGILFAVIFGINYVANLLQITKLQPTDLMREGKKGEHEPKHLILKTITGVILLAIGYGVALSAKLDTWIFLKFPLAVMFVIPGTYLFLTAGIILFIKQMKNSKTVYYSRNHFVVIAGMLYRMKKSAASLVNICLFSSMMIMTVVCTIALSLGQNKAIAFFNPFDLEVIFHSQDAVDEGDQSNAVAGIGQSNTETALNGIEHVEDINEKAQIEKEFTASIETLADQHQVELSDMIRYQYGSLRETQKEDTFIPDTDSYVDMGDYTIRLIPLWFYNELQNETVTLESDEVLVFSTFSTYGYPNITINDNRYDVKEEVDALRIDRKEPNSYSNRYYYIIMKNMECISQLTDGVLYNTVRCNMIGDEVNIRDYLQEVRQVYDAIGRGFSIDDVYSYGDQVRSMNGGLLFIGVFFGLIFSMSLVLVMYYKQISEGMEDQDSFHIMKQVGMSEEDIQLTIRKQIMLVFAIPAAMAILHILMALKLLINFMYALNLYDTGKTLLAFGLVLILYGCFYAGSYLMTAKSYYRIVVK